MFRFYIAPFDIRYTYYTGRSRGFHCMSRPEVMRHMLAGENLALCVGRQGQVVGGKQWNLVFLSYGITDFNLFYRGGNVNYPLYLYPSAEAPDIQHVDRQPNFAEWLLPRLSEAYGFIPTPEEVIAYIYAILYSPTYRKKYVQELRIDFPHVPFTADRNLFKQMAAFGQELIDLHLLRKWPQVPVVKYQGQGGDQIEFVRYDPSAGRVSINRDKYFEGITPQMWEYHIGGYQVLEKYLRDRKGRYMDDPVRYIHIAAIIARTMEIQKEIDQIYSKVETNVLP